MMVLFSPKLIYLLLMRLITAKQYLAVTKILVIRHTVDNVVIRVHVMCASLSLIYIFDAIILFSTIFSYWFLGK